MVNINKRIKGLSVIIIAYLRKEYIIQAIRSVLNQDFDRQEYEILVVKNFTDSDIDKFISDNGIVNILSSNDSLGAKFVEGVQRSNGEIVCLLEDDDIFVASKLKEVYNTFSNAPNLCYYHNNTGFIDDDGNLMKDFSTLSTRKTNNLGDFYLDSDKKDRQVFKLFEIGAHWNNSCISIRRNFFDNYISMLSRIKTLFDGALLFAALCSSGDIFITTKVLTHYRFNVNSATQKAKFDNDAHSNIAMMNINDNLLITECVVRKLGNKSRTFERAMADRASWELKRIVYSKSAKRLDAIKYLYSMISKYDMTPLFLKSNMLTLSGLFLFIVSPKLSKKSHIT